MRLKEIRISRKLKVQEVTEYLCCSPSVYSRYESGKREPSIETLLRLSKLFKVSVDELLVTEDEAMMVQAMRQADERACQDALVLLRCHKTK